MTKERGIKSHVKSNEFLSCVEKIPQERRVFWGKISNIKTDCLLLSSLVQEGKTHKNYPILIEEQASSFQVDMNYLGVERVKEPNPLGRIL